MLGATVRVSALITRQPQEVRQRIRAAFNRLADGYRAGDGLELPVAVKLATAQNPAPDPAALCRRISKSARRSTVESNWSRPRYSRPGCRVSAWWRAGSISHQQ